MSKETIAINLGNSEEKPNKPGEFLYVHHNGKICGIDYCCPCGVCKDTSYLPLAGTELSTEPCWNFDGNIERPSLTPSILRRAPCKWHGYLTKGVFVEC